MFTKNYSLTKSRRILKRGYSLYKKKGNRLSTSQYHEFEGNLKDLDQALLDKNKKRASEIAKDVDNFIKIHFPKTAFDIGKEIVGALVFAIVVAFCIRQFWFELYEVPTGSMRPTVEEQDRLVVSKTTFGINFPFTNKLWLFKPERIQRGSIIVFTTVDMDIPDSDMRYFLIFPGKKRFIKRCVARGGDTLYFYGGRIYAVDKEGTPLLELADEKWLQKNGIAPIDHIPFITFNGKAKATEAIMPHVYSESTLHQMNKPIGKLTFEEKGIEGLFYNGTMWTKENLSLLTKPHKEPVSYGDLWGINNYAQVRMLTPREAREFYPSQAVRKKESAYLEIRHTPNLTYPAPLLRQSESFATQPLITPFTTLLPLEETHLAKIRESMTTARFVVQDERAFRYTKGTRRNQPPQFDPKLPHVPNGTYEFYKGTAYAIHFGGIRTQLKKDHPLYSKEPSFIYTLFNMGISFNTLYKPSKPDQPFIPQRFAFYREGNLFVMGESLFAKEELIPFVENELKKEGNSSKEQPYIAFVDRGPPLKEGKLDVDFIKAFGLKVPEGHVVALGDNYASSADSRDFGFVPDQNLRGAPSFTFWPPGERLGPLPQPSYPWITLPNILIWSLATVVILLSLLFVRKRNGKSIFE